MSDDAERNVVAGRRGPLAGIRVLDLTRIVSGPICTRMLSDLGAEVIKVEAADGDSTRSVAPHINGSTPYFAQMNVGKLDVSIDIRVPAGASLLRDLAAKCDVLVENFRPNVLARFGLGPEEAFALNPRLIYCSISGWGRDNSWSDRKSMAPVVHAETGRLEMDARVRGASPEQEVHVHGDIYPGLLAASGVLAALYEREVTGRGQQIDVAMAESMVWCDEWASTNLVGFSEDHAFDIWTNVVAPLADGTLVTIVGNPRRALSGWASALGGDPPQGTVTLTEAKRIIAKLLSNVADLETLELLVRDHAMVVAEARSLSQLAETPWAKERGLFYEADAGVRVPAAPFRFSSSDIGASGRVPRIGENTRQVLEGLLGLTSANVDRLAQLGAIRTVEAPATDHEGG